MLKTAFIDPIVKIALHEDIGANDITTHNVVPKPLHIKAAVIAGQKGVLCGVSVAERVFRLVDENLRYLPAAKDGDILERGREIAYIEGSAQHILSAERTALNFISHLSGIATKTRAFVDKIKGSGARILDTRKTTPGLRILEKYAVSVGGGKNHRFGLYDQVLIKDNHLLIMRKRSIPDIVADVRKAVLKKTVIGVEVKNLMEFQAALKSSADYILLDNMQPETVRGAVNLKKRQNSKIELEVSGGVNIDNVLEYAQTGVERISIGALTHSVQAIDISLDIVG